MGIAQLFGWRNRRDAVRKVQSARARLEVTVLEDRVTPVVIPSSQWVGVTVGNVPAVGVPPNPTPGNAEVVPRSYPDTSVAANDTQVLQVANQFIRLTDKNGVVDSVGPLRTFFDTAYGAAGTVTAGGEIYNPVVIYHEYEQRFWVMALHRVYTAGPNVTWQLLIAKQAAATLTSPGLFGGNWIGIGVNTPTVPIGSATGFANVLPSALTNNTPQRNLANQNPAGTPAYDFTANPATLSTPIAYPEQAYMGYNSRVIAISIDCHLGLDNAGKSLYTGTAIFRFSLPGVLLGGLPTIFTSDTSMAGMPFPPFANVSTTALPAQFNNVLNPAFTNLWPYPYQGMVPARMHNEPGGVNSGGLLYFVSEAPTQYPSGNPAPPAGIDPMLSRANPTPASPENNVLYVFALGESGSYATVRADTAGFIPDTSFFRIALDPIGADYKRGPLALVPNRNTGQMLDVGDTKVVSVVWRDNFMVVAQTTRNATDFVSARISRINTAVGLRDPFSGRQTAYPLRIVAGLPAPTGMSLYAPLQVTLAAPFANASNYNPAVEVIRTTTGSYDVGITVTASSNLLAPSPFALGIRAAQLGTAVAHEIPVVILPANATAVRTESPMPANIAGSTTAQFTRAPVMGRYGGIGIDPATNCFWATNETSFVPTQPNDTNWGTGVIGFCLGPVPINTVSGNIPNGQPQRVYPPNPIRVFNPLRWTFSGNQMTGQFTLINYGAPITGTMELIVTFPSSTMAVVRPTTAIPDSTNRVWRILVGSGAQTYATNVPVRVTVTILNPNRLPVTSFFLRRADSDFTASP